MALIWYIGIITILVIDKTQADFKVSTQDLTVHLNSQESFDLYLTEMLSEDIVVKFEVQHQDLVRINPDELNILNISILIICNL